MSLQIPPLPPGERPPALEKMAGLLSRSLPESQRAEGHALLLEQILPSRLNGLAEHPKPRRLTEVVYEDLANELRVAEQEARLAVLRAAALRAEADALAADALSLAIARYLADHPEAADAAADWKTAAVERWREKPLKELQDAATKRLALLDELEARIESEHPGLWEPLRLAFLHSKMNLQSARSGSFGTASGSLYSFLSALGVAVDNFDFH
ncbi:MAG: hypothetical protein QOH65_682 [Methylobacteriaceae bacterium]|nr:hypothetical protein [Methylobacteriaceae bacterium]